MPSPETIAKSFRELDFHDDTFIDLRVVPSQQRGEGAQSLVEIELLHYPETKLRIRFFGCANLRVAMDFDVLAHNLPANTSRVEAPTNLNPMRDLIRSQTKDWDVTHAPGDASPINGQMDVMNHFDASMM